MWIKWLAPDFNLSCMLMLSSVRIFVARLKVKIYVTNCFECCKWSNCTLQWTFIDLAVFLQCFILERLAFIVLSLLNFYGCHNANLFFWCSLYVLGLDIGPDFILFFGQYFFCFWSSKLTTNLVYFCGVHEMEWNCHQSSNIMWTLIGVQKFDFDAHYNCLEVWSGFVMLKK
jgi:hypothetical protein